jgi:hypothetical protein
MKKHTSVHAVGAFGMLAAASITSAALAGGPIAEVIYTKIPTHSTSLVPGARDLSGNPAVTNFRALEQITLSPDGSRWMLIGRTQQGSDLETIMLIGSDTSGTTFLQEGQPVPGGAPGELIDFFNTIGRFNENNEFAMTLRARPTSATFNKVLFYNGGLTPSMSDFTLVARGGSTPGGDLYAGLSDLAPNPSGDERVGNSIGSVHLLNDRTIGAQDSTIINVHTSRRPATFYSNAVTPGGGLVLFTKFKQVGVDTFLGVDGSTVHTYDTSTGGLSSNSFYTSPDGLRWLVHGDILSAPTSSDTVLVVDGKAELQESLQIPGGGANDLVHSFVTSDVAANGDWYSRGTRRANPADTTSNGAWAVRNGQLMALTGQPISAPANGPSENWGASIYTFTGNAKGDYVIVGKTDNANTAIDDVVVVNGEVVMREGDPIDLDGNGEFDDDVFIGRGNNTLAAFETDDAVLTDAKMLYIFISIRDGQGNDLNSNPAFGSPQAFVRLNLGGGPTPCGPDIHPVGSPDGVVGVGDLLTVIGSWGACAGKCPPSCNADITGDCTVGVADLLAVIAGWGPCPK